MQSAITIEDEQQKKKRRNLIIGISITVVVIVVALALFFGLYYGLKPVNGMQTYLALKLKTPEKVKSKNSATLIFFYTLGNPFDKGKDLTDDANNFRRMVENQVTDVVEYNSKALYNIDPKMCAKVLYAAKGPFLHQSHYNGCNIGFLSWKPFIIQHQLKKMEENEILFYHDCLESNNIKFSFEKPLEPFLLELLQTVKADIFVPFEGQGILAKKYVKKKVFETIGKYNDEYKNWPHLNAGRIIIRKTSFTVELVDDWLKECLNRELIMPETEKEIDLDFNSQDNAILTVICRKAILENKLPSDWPKIWFDKTFEKQSLKIYEQ